jgi:hypothetical protein
MAMLASQTFDLPGRYWCIATAKRNRQRLVLLRCVQVATQDSTGQYKQITSSQYRLLAIELDGTRALCHVEQQIFLAVHEQRRFERLHARTPLATDRIPLVIGRLDWIGVNQESSGFASSQGHR